MSFPSPVMPPRPGKGTLGKPIKVIANMYPVTDFTKNIVHQYEFKCEPWGSPQSRLRVFAELMKKCSAPGGELGGIYPVFDGNHLLYTAKALPQPQITLRITLPDEGSSSGGSGGSGSGSEQKRRRGGNDFTVEVIKRAEVDMSKLVPFLKGEKVETPSDALMVLNLVIGQKGSELYTQSCRGLYTPDRKMSLGGGLEAWRGWKLSIRPGQGVPLLNINAAATAFLKAGPLTTFIADMFGFKSFEQVKWDKGSRERVNHLLSKSRVQVNHRGEIKRKYRFKKIVDQDANHIRFPVEHEGVTQEMTLFQFFQIHYGKTLRYPNAPCVSVGPTNKDTFLPIECCDVPQGQPYVRKLSPEQTANMITFTCLRPQVRLTDIKAGFDEMVGGDNKFVNEFGLLIKNQPAEIPARILPYPKVKYGGSGADANLSHKELAAGAWNLAGKMVTAAIELKSWAVVNLARLDDTDVQGFTSEFVKTGKKMGLKFKLERPPIVKTSPTKDMKQVILDIGKTALDATKAPPSLIVIVLPDKGAELYKRLKIAGDTDIGVVTQCVQRYVFIISRSSTLTPPFAPSANSSHVKKKNIQYIANVLIKVNAKLEGLNQTVSSDSVKAFSDRPTMLVGADVTHPAPGQLFKPSVAAVVGSMDREFCRYASRFSIQRQKETTGAGELERTRGPSDTMELVGKMVSELIRIFADRNGVRPARLIFYRDGVASNQFREVLSREVQAVLRACSQLDESYRPTLTYIVVQKRHNVRFFPMSPTESDKSGNVQPGTCIDTHIVHPGQYDFFLNSHAGLQGTSRPAHYTVIYDENAFKPDQLQAYTFNLCYEYAKATRSVSLCPPAYYAHLAAKRAALHFAGDEFDESISASGSTPSFDFFASKFRSVHPRIASTMYYM
ncbi:hypothetical protein HK101_007575 [Irineochytrium annulatum]|nr:hypothetical protein HK101_007575 [Irineochytrium annulatum]